MVGQFRHLTPPFCFYQHRSLVITTTFADKIECHSETLDRFREGNRGRR